MYNPLTNVTGCAILAKQRSWKLRNLRYQRLWFRHEICKIHLAGMMACCRPGSTPKRLTPKGLTRAFRKSQRDARPNSTSSKTSIEFAVCRSHRDCRPISVGLKYFKPWNPCVAARVKLRAFALSSQETDPTCDCSKVTRGIDISLWVIFLASLWTSVPTGGKGHGLIGTLI